MRRIELKKQIRKLRGRGKTYSEIQKTLNIKIPKSTLSNWCKDVELPIWYKNKITELNDKNSRKALKIAWTINKKKREDFLESLESEAIKTTSSLSLNRENLKIVLASLYLGEGAKWKSHSGLMLGSSDPNIILFYLKLLEKCYDIKPYQMKCRISFRADQDIKKLEAFWSKVTKIPRENFYKTKPDPRTIGKKTLKTEYKGVCVVTCKGANIQLELEQIINLLMERLGPVA